MIFETVVTTVNEAGACHIAQMGMRRDGEHYVIAPFKPSTTLVNLQQSGQAVINLTDDVCVIAGCLTGRHDWPLMPADEVQGFVLQSALSHIEVAVDKVEQDELRPRFYCREVCSRQHGGFRGFNRAQAAVVEAAILVSRLDRLPREKIESELALLAIAVEKTAGEREQQAWQWLTERVADYYGDGAA
ncbi:MAG: DUF447 domain-containing protein [Gammaproteobacteria bacterium]